MRHAGGPCKADSLSATLPTEGRKLRHLALPAPVSLPALVQQAGTARTPAVAHFKIAHLARRGGVYYFRAPVPRGLVEKFSCREIKLSLQTRDPQIARLRCRACSSAFERLVAGVRGMPELTQEQITKLLRGFLEQELSKSA